ncbi:Alpha/Beta hydrolase protein [Apodospora peruviana]|uniref:Alpha/Beta hydrolase protein n=1 Tax=Apodospora peruviana TaxID=516989 RepID=A0AAE0MGC6_9PEZI|nr:Alpha/Beta hydrolase protein [Apodospora peruviana]
MLFGLAAASATMAQNTVPAPKDTQRVESKNYPGASISYKQTSLCETTSGVKSYSGYVNLPSSLLADVPATTYNVSLFFWYFEARKDAANAPVSIYIGGGPGASGMDDSSGFPCKVNPDTNSTTLNSLSWNDKVNMLYIDQPVTTGFSYTSIVNGIMDLLSPSYDFIPLEDGSKFEQTNITTVGATISPRDPSMTVNTTMQAARTMWHFAQVWFQEFPEYKTTNDEISIWTVSYGGYFAPAIFAHVERQNELIRNNTHPDKSASPLHLATIGLQNACVDAATQGSQYPEYAFNNTYGISAIPQEIYEAARTNFTKPGGCADLISACRSAGLAGDPLETGANSTVNEICAAASMYCFGVVQGAYTTYSNRNAFDIARLASQTFPVDYNSAFFNREWVQAELGVPVNFTLSSNMIVDLFFAVTGDPMRRTYADLEYLLQKGKNVVMVYGDRDYRCNWLGAEKLSLVMEHSGTAEFRKAGYASIKTNGSYEGGFVRQAGNLSFSRVFEAGHNVAAYQPETVLRIFERAMKRKDVATGQEDAGTRYSSKGLADTFAVKNEVPQNLPAQVCLVFDAGVTCAKNQIEALRDGSAATKDFVLLEPTAEVDDGSAATPGDGGGNGTTPKPRGSENLAGRMVASGVAGSVIGLVWLCRLCFW